MRACAPRRWEPIFRNFLPWPVGAGHDRSS